MIGFQCACGKQLQSRDEHAGQMTRCPACGREQAIPTAGAPTQAVRATEALDTAYESDSPGKPVTSRKAVASTVLGVLGIFPCMAVTGLPALILGFLSQRDIARSRGLLAGQGFAIAGIVLGIISLILSVSVVPIGLLLPAVQKVRDAAGRMSSQNHLMRMAMSVHAFHDENGFYPPPVVYNEQGQPLHSWRVLLLPYLGEKPLFDQFKLDEPWDSPHNRALLNRMPEVYHDPGWDQKEPGTTTYLAFVGPDAVFEQGPRHKLIKAQLRGHSKPIHFYDTRIRFGSVIDGTSNTVMIVEAEPGVPWSSPQDIDCAPGRPLPLLGLKRRNVIQCAFADGSVRALPKSLNEQTLRALISRSGGEVIQLP